MENKKKQAAEPVQEEKNASTSKRKKNKRKRTSRMILIVLLAILAVLAVVAVLLFNHRKEDPWKGTTPGESEMEESVDETMGDETIDPAAPTVDEDMAKETIEDLEQGPSARDKGWLHYLLLGIDDINGRGRSDAMIVLSISKEEKQVVLSSIPRDTYVYVEGIGFSKINSAYRNGGAELTMKTFEQNFDMDIENYFVVTFKTLPEIVDLVGGVTLTLTDAEAEHMGRQYAAWGLSGGTQVLNGKEVLAYCRVRRIDSDYKRNDRQFKALMAIYEEVKDLSANEYIPLAKAAYNSVYSDMTVGNMLLLLKDVMGILDSSQIRHEKLVDGQNSHAGNFGDSSIVMVDNLVEVSTRWRENLGIEDYEPSKRLQQISDQLDRTLGR